MWLLEAHLCGRDNRVEPACESEALHQGRQFRNVVRDDHVPPSSFAQQRQDGFSIVEDLIPVRCEDALPQSNERSGEMGVGPPEPDERLSEAAVDSVLPGF